MSAPLLVLAGALLAAPHALPHQFSGEESSAPSLSTSVQIYQLDNGLSLNHSVRSEREAAVVNGTLSIPGMRTYTVEIGYGPRQTRARGCFGSVISPRFVLTTAYCALPTRSTGPARWVMAGDRSGPKVQDGTRTQMRRVVHRLVHPHYSPPYHDIALLMLDRILRFGPWVQPACLHRTSGVPQDKATLTRWEALEGDEPTEIYVLLEAEVILFNDTECQQLHPAKSSKAPRGIDPEIMFCAGQFSKNTDACQADSGAPLVIPLDENCYTVLIGVSSFGDLCASSDTPAVYTRVSHYFVWIQSLLYKYYGFD